MVKFLCVLAVIGAAFVINCINDVQSLLVGNLPNLPTTSSNCKICNMTDGLSECICGIFDKESGLLSAVLNIVGNVLDTILGSGTKCQELDISNFVQQLCFANQLQIIADIIECISIDIDKNSEDFSAPGFLGICLSKISSTFETNNPFTNCDEIGGNVDFVISVDNDAADGREEFEKFARIEAILTENECFYFLH